MKINTRDIQKSIDYRTRQTGQKSLWSHFSKFMAKYIVKLLLHTPVTPNQVSMACVGIVIVAAVLFAQGTFQNLIIGALLLFFACILDDVDGNLARCRGITTKIQSSFLCTLYHHVPSVIFLGMGIGVYRATENLIYLYLGFAASFTHILSAYLLLLRQNSILKNLDYCRIDMKKTAGARKFAKNRLQAIILKALASPVYYIKEITLFAVLANQFFWSMALEAYVVFYGVYLAARLIPFYIYAYYSLKKIEKRAKKK